jgi:hypothetical protein
MRTIKLVVALLLLNQSLSAQNLELVGKIFANTPADAARCGDYLYVVNVGLVILDFSNPANPTIVKHLTPLEGMVPYELIIDGSSGYAAWGGGGIMKMSFNNPVNPSRDGLINEAYDCSHLQLHGSALFSFAKSHADGTLFLMATEASNGQILDKISLVNGFLHHAFEAKRFIIDGNHLYLTMGPRGEKGDTELHIFEVANPANIAYVSSVSLGLSSPAADVLQSSHWDLVKRNNCLYVAARFVAPKCHLKIVDVSNPTAPRVVKEWSDASIASYSGDIELAENNLLLTDQSSGFNVISITNDTLLSLSRRLSGFVPPYYKINFAMRKSGNHAFLFDEDCYAVFTFDVTTPGSAKLIDTIPFAHDWKDISIANKNTAFASVWNFYQLYTLDTRNIFAPSISQRTEVRGWGWGIDVKKNFAYLAMGLQVFPPPEESGGLQVYDLSNPFAPQKRGWSPPYPGNHDVQVFTDTTSALAYVIAGQPNSEGESFENHLSARPGLRIVDVSDPDSLVQLGAIGIKPQCRGVFQKGNYVYIAASSPDSSSSVIDASGLYIVDASNPANPFIAGQWVRTAAAGHTRAVYVKDDFAFLAHYNYLTVLDVSNPASPSLATEITDLGRTQCMEVLGQDNFVFVLKENALLVFDILNPASPTLVATAYGMFFSPARHFDIDWPYIYVVSAAGVHVFRFNTVSEVNEQEESSYKSLPELFQNYPNPFNPSTVIGFQLSVKSRVTLKVFDVNGREVVTLVDGEMTAGNYAVRFEARELASGVYFYEIKAGRFRQRKKMIIME